MEDGCAKVRSRRLLWVLRRNIEVQLPYSSGEGRVRRPGEKNVELREIVNIVGAGWEEVVGRQRLVVEGGVVGGQAAEGARVLYSVSPVVAMCMWDSIPCSVSGTFYWLMSVGDRCAAMCALFKAVTQYNAKTSTESCFFDVVGSMIGERAGQRVRGKPPLLPSFLPPHASLPRSLSITLQKICDNTAYVPPLQHALKP